jgi:lipid-binding SYLF domain-containing protein
MQRRKLLVIGAMLASLPLASAYAEDKAAERAEIKTKIGQALEDFYAADPSLKADVAKAPGYAAFTTYGLTFGFGGAGGKGLAHDAKTKKDTYMNIAQASAGVQIGASETRYLFVFNTPDSLHSFIDKGWDASASAAAGAGTGKKSTSVGAGIGEFTGGRVYVLTKTGLQVGAALAGTKAWKDKDLN